MVFIGRLPGLGEVQSLRPPSLQCRPGQNPEGHERSDMSVSDFDLEDPHNSARFFRSEKTTNMSFFEAISHRNSFHV